MDISKEKRKRMYMWVENKYAPPLKAVLNLTYKCNLNCLFCGDVVNRRNKSIDYNDELADKDWIRLVKDCSNIGVKEWWFPGIGEPLMRKGLLQKLIDTIKRSKKSYCKITTNGTLFDDYFSTKIVDKGIDEISLSLDSVNPNTHDYLRGQKGAFKKLVCAARTLKSLKKKYKRSKPIISINFVLTQKNYQEFKSLIMLAKSLGVKKISVNPLRIDSGNYPHIKKENLRMTKKQMEKLKEEIPSIRDYAKGEDIQFDINSLGELELIHDVKGEKRTVQGYNTKKKFKTYEQKLINSPCHEPWYCLAIDPFGNITPCTSAGNENIISSIKKESIKEIWSGKEFKKIRECILNNKPLKVCSKCLLSSVREHSKKIMCSEDV